MSKTALSGGATMNQNVLDNLRADLTGDSDAFTRATYRIQRQKYAMASSVSPGDHMNLLDCLGVCVTGEGVGWGL